MQVLQRSYLASAKPWLASHVLQRRPQPSAQGLSHVQRQQASKSIRVSAAAEDPPATDIVQATQPDVADVPEEVFYEGSGAQAELVLSLLLGATLVYLPITVASLGRHLWVKYKFTNKRIISVTSSPFIKRETQIEYKQIKEVRTAPRAFGMWGDMVIFLKDGTRLEILGLERCQEIKNYMLGCML